MLRLTTFGGLALSRDGTALTGAAAQRSRLSLLALLATAGPSGFSRDKLLLHLWPESDQERARHALKQAVYSLRRELGADDVIVGTASLSLNPLIITSDVREFEAAVAAGDFASAAAVYTGPFLDGVHLKDSIEFERWSADQRAHYAHMWCTAVEKLATAAERRGEWREAAGHWRRLAGSEPLSGRLTLALIRALAESGDLGAALQQYKIHEALLREELDAAPEPDVQSFVEGLRSGAWKRSPEKQGAATASVMDDRGEAVSPAVAAALPSPGVSANAPSPATISGNDVAGSSMPPAPTVKQAEMSARPDRRRRRTAMAFVLGMLLVTALGLSIGYRRLGPTKRAVITTYRSRSEVKAVPKRISVAPFENRTSDPTNKYLGEQIAEYLNDEMRYAGFKVVSGGLGSRMNWKLVNDIPRFLLSGRDKAIALAREEHSEFVVTGAIYRNGGNLEARAVVKDADSKEELSHIRVSAPADSTGKLIQSLVLPVVTFLRKTVDSSASAMTLRHTNPPSLQAHQRVSLAYEKFFTNSRDTSVLSALDSAAALDTTWATPLALKGYILDVKGMWPGLAEVMRKLDSRPGVYRLAPLEACAFAMYRSDLEGNQFARLKYAYDMVSISKSPEMPLLITMSSLYAGRTRDAMAAFSDAIPDYEMNLAAPMYFDWGVEVSHNSGALALEDSLVRVQRERFPNHPPTYYNWVRVLATANSRDLRKVVDEGIPPAFDKKEPPRDLIGGRHDLMLLAGRELRAHGHVTEAQDFFRRAVAELETVRGKPTSAQMHRRAHALYEAGNWKAAQQAFQAIVDADSTDIEAEGRLATAAARASDAATAVRIDAHLASMDRPYMMGRNLRWRANIAAVQGRETDALALLEAAVRKGHRLMDTPTNLVVHDDADFVGIQKGAGYKAMLKRLADSPLKGDRDCLTGR